MDKPTEVLGYLACGTCLTPKAIKHCKGRRSAYLMGNCECGPDQRTGKAAQAKMSGFKPLEEVQGELDALKAPAPVVVSEPIETKNEPETKSLETQPQAEDKPNDETQLPETNPMSTAACVGMGALAGLVFGGLIKTLKAVA